MERPERVSRVDLGLALAGAMGWPTECLRRARQDDVKHPAPRPKDLSLDSSKARAALPIPLKPLAEGLRGMV